MIYHKLRAHCLSPGHPLLQQITAPLVNEDPEDALAGPKYILTSDDKTAFKIM
jgi:hypothetical protein